jgi:hypothetical protein
MLMNKIESSQIKVFLDEDFLKSNREEGGANLVKGVVPHPAPRL